MSGDSLGKIILAYGLANIVLYVIEKLTSRLRTFHRVLSAVDTLALWALACLIAYSIQPVFVVPAAVLLLFEYPIVWGLRTELSEDERASFVGMYVSIPIPSAVRRKLSLVSLEILTFPIFYLEKSWLKAGEEK